MYNVFNSKSNYLPGGYFMKTLENLMAAFNGESNAHAKYTAYAKKADEEGYGSVASLFRAAAAAEEIHFKNHAKVITQMGGTPKADIKPVVPKSTAENLQDAIHGENYEKDIMYPEFIKVAEAEGNKAALRTFDYALDAEICHAALYSEALAELESHKNSAAKVFFVCPICGYTVETIDFEKCPACNLPAEKFLEVK
jgi:rubrerythrin